MYGLEAIDAHNGWAIAIIGTGIVFSGLVVLSIAISQLHKLLILWDKRDKFINPNGQKKIKSDISMPERFPQDINEVAELYKPIFAKLEATFQLAELYKLSQTYNFPHPHLTIKNFRQAQILVPVGNGNFKVNMQTSNNQG